MSKPAGALSKSDMPIDRRSWQEIQADFFKHRTAHFAVGTEVRSNGVLGTITRESLDGGSRLVIEWVDGIITTIPNPNYRRN